jgi:hypothetical protein
MPKRPPTRVRRILSQRFFMLMGEPVSPKAAESAQTALLFVCALPAILKRQWPNKHISSRSHHYTLPLEVTFIHFHLHTFLYISSRSQHKVAHKKS